MPSQILTSSQINWREKGTLLNGIVYCPKEVCVTKCKL